MNDCVFSSFVSSASSSGIGSYAQAARMGTGLMGASSSAMGGMVAWMNGNQCGDISEVVVTPDKSWVVPVAETTNTILDNIGSSLKNHGGNSTWGSNGHFYWHGASEQGFYGNQYVSTMKLTNIGRRITKFTGFVCKVTDGIDIYYGYKEDGSQIGYYTLRAVAGATGSYVGDLAGVWAGGLAGAKMSAMIGSWLGVAGAVPGAIIGGAIGGVFLSERGSWAAKETFDRSRALNDLFLLNYGLQGLNALLLKGNFVDERNYYEDFVNYYPWWNTEPVWK